MFQMRSLYFALLILGTFIWNVSASKCGVIAPDCQVLGDGVIWEQLKQCPKLPICKKGFKLVSDNINGETRCCCIFGSSSSSNQQAPTICNWEQQCAVGKIWNPNLCECADIPSPEIPSLELSPLELTCLLKGCKKKYMDCNEIGECVSCGEFSYWNDSLQKCYYGCVLPVEGCEEGELVSNPGYCFCSKCLPGYFTKPKNFEDLTSYPSPPCSKTCYREPCPTYEVWNQISCRCVNIHPSPEIPSLE